MNESGFITFYPPPSRHMFTQIKLSALGEISKSGKGICELLGVDTADVDVMMGTFTITNVLTCFFLFFYNIILY